MAKRVKRYQSHKIKSREEAIIEINKDPCSKDRFYIQIVLNCTKEYLDKNSIFEYQDFIQSFQRFGLKNKDIIKFIIEFVRYYNSLPKIGNDNKIIWIKQRECRQSNFGEKNMIINRIVHQYEDETKDYIVQFAKQNFTDAQEQQDFTNDLMNKIELIKNQSLNKNFIQAELSSNFEDTYFNDDSLSIPITASEEYDQYDFDLFETFEY